MTNITWTGLAIAVSTVAAVAFARAQGTAVLDPAVTGAIDVHSHQDPDSTGPNSGTGPRASDAFDVARLAKERGMRAVVLKEHYDQSAGLAYLVRKQVPGIEIFGGITLNLPMGGVNPAAVRHMAEMKGGWGRVVWMPTLDSENNVRRSGKNRPFAAVARNGQLLPEAKEVLEIIAKTKTRDSNGELVLATGHVSPEEVLLLLREGKAVGVKHMLVVHPLLESVGMNMAQMQEATRLGAFLEFVSSFARGADAEAKTREYVDAIRKVGPQFCIISSDLGQLNSPLHPDGLATAAKALRQHGFTEHELHLMFKENPARLLGLQAPPTN
jgi:hypothetical protein